MWPRRHQDASAPGPVPLSPEATLHAYMRPKSCFPFIFPLRVESRIRGRLYRVISNLCILLRMLRGFARSEFLVQMLQSFCLRCHSSMCHGLNKGKTRRWFTFCLMPIHEEAALGQGPVLPDSGRGGQTVQCPRRVSGPPPPLSLLEPAPRRME